MCDETNWSGGSFCWNDSLLLSFQKVIAASEAILELVSIRLQEPRLKGCSPCYTQSPRAGHILWLRHLLNTYVWGASKHSLGFERPAPILEWTVGHLSHILEEQCCQDGSSSKLTASSERGELKWDLCNGSFTTCKELAVWGALFFWMNRKYFFIVPGLIYLNVYKVIFDEEQSYLVDSHRDLSSKAKPEAMTSAQF